MMNGAPVDCCSFGGASPTVFLLVAALMIVLGALIFKDIK